MEVTLDTDRPKVVEEVQRAIQAAPEVMQAYYVTGNADYILVITARNTADYEAFARKFLSKRPARKIFSHEHRHAPCEAGTDFAAQV